MINIEKVDNGYVVSNNYIAIKVFITTEDLFEYLLIIFEGRNKIFKGDLYAKIIIEREVKP